MNQGHQPKRRKTKIKIKISTKFDHDTYMSKKVPECMLVVYKPFNFLGSTQK